jgi:hypothetical protein
MVPQAMDEVKGWPLNVIDAAIWFVLRGVPPVFVTRMFRTYSQQVEVHFTSSTENWLCLSDLPPYVAVKETCVPSAAVTITT